MPSLDKEARCMNIACNNRTNHVDRLILLSHAVQILNDKEARFNSADMNVAYRMGVDEYQRLCPYAGELEANWGKPPGLLP